MTFATVQPWQSAKWRCVLIGSERLLIECAIRLQDQGHEVIAIVSDQPAIVEWAYKARIMTLDHAASLIDAHLPAFDYLFSITNLRVLGPDVLMLPRRAAINFHDGLLPAYAGLNVPVWALLNGEAHHGISWHLMTVDVDAGDILLARSFDLDRDDSALSINTKCFVAALDSFDMLIVGLATGSIIPQPQDDVQGRFYGLGDRLPCGGAIDWNSPARTIADYVRALDHGHYANPVGAIKASVGGQVFLIGTATAQAGKSDHPAGTIVSTSSDGLRVATSTADIVISRLSTCSGLAIMEDDQFVHHGFVPGARMDHPSAQQQDSLTAMTNAVGRFEPWWRERLARRHPLLLPNIDYAATRLHDTLVHSDQAGLRSDETKGHERFVLAALVAYLGRIADKQRFDLGYSDPILTSPCIGVEAWFASQLPMGIAIDFGRNLSYLREAIGAEIRQLRRKIGHMADLFARSPELRRDDGQDPSTLPVAIIIVDDLDDAVPRTDADLTIAMRSDGDACRWFHDPCRLDSQAIERMQAGFLTLLDAARRDPAMAIGALPIITTDEQDKIIAGWNATQAPVREDICLHQLFVEQAQRTPSDPAVTCRGETLTYAEVDRRSNQLARHLRSLGVGPDMLIGLNVERSVNLLVAMIAIHKAGGAYLPLDPTYPSDRVAYMIKDARATIIITDHALLSALAPTDATILCLDSDWPAISKLSSAPVLSTVQSENLAYVIYTSGSTGKPKGVMVEHRNAVNFFAGMDCEIEAPGTWLAVTSLSFDISVLELYWTLTRGFHVVLATSDALRGGPARVNAPRPPMGFSLFYFPTADSCSAADQYRLLIEGAKFADTHDFDAVWTPERHFHAFGGLYPNPSVASAAIATITSRVKIRGGSVVLPLHHPIRVAEEWSLVDNLSHGRVGISFAAGWQPNDFVLRPDAFADRNAVMMKGIETVRALWRGETCAFPGPLGTLVDTATFPRPVQPELPVWITSAGNADTFAAAGTAGTFLLTHLLGQTVDELTAKIGRYRAAWAAAGHVGEGHVTLMLHSFVGEDAQAVRDAVRAPMIAYLRSSTDLVKQFAWSFPAFKRRPGMEDSSAQTDLSSITDAEMDALLDHAFDRYYATSGLFGTPQDCLEMVDRVRKAGVDEIGCLIDFGLPVQQALDHLPSLDALRQLANAPLEGDGDTLPALMERHHVTHLQCTPSMAHMLVADDDARIQLKKLKRLMVGGEAFPPALAQELLNLVDGAVMNMYGPTETTIWSSVHILDGQTGAVPLGKPLANQQIFILDSRQQLLPPGIPGELVIAGDGVVRGYLHRPELTAERFIPHPFRNGERAYRTGDLARQRPDGTLDFLGRLDHQVKIRGYRIELGEVEAVLSSHPAVEQAIVSAREDTPGDVRLVGYYVPADVSCPPRDVLRDFMRVHLPEFMVPQLLVETSALPRTPNGKVDRNALPAPKEAEGRAVTMLHVAPDDAMERKVAAIWCDVLKLDSVGTRDNFFDIGGHSLLAVQVHRHLRAALDMPLALTDIFRFPTIHALSAHLSDGNRDEGALLEVHARGAERRAAYNRRRSLKSAMTAQD